jgi:hypothetical protein
LLVSRVVPSNSSLNTSFQPLSPFGGVGVVAAEVYDVPRKLLEHKANTITDKTLNTDIVLFFIHIPPVKLSCIIEDESII